MDSKKLLKSISNSFFSESADNAIYFSMSDKIMSDYKEVLELNVKVLNLAELDCPLTPFLDILKKMNIPAEQLDEYVYGLQRDIFESFLSCEKIKERKEPLVIEEINYEKLRMREAIVQLLSKNLDSNIVVFNAQLMSDEALKILVALENTECKGKFVFCFNSLEVENYSPSIRAFIYSIINTNRYYSFNSYEAVQKKQILEQETDLEEEIESVHVSAAELLEKLRAMRLFMDLEKAYRLCKRIDAEKLLADFEISSIRQIDYEMGLISFFYGDVDFASLCFNNVVEYQIDDELTCYALYMMANVENSKNMTSVAVKHVNRALINARKYSDRPIYALLVKMDYVVTEKTDSEYSTTKYFNALDLLEKFGLKNNKIHTMLTIPYGVIYDNELRHQMTEYVNLAKKEAEKIGNKFVLSTACHWMGIIMTHEGLKEVALEWYERCFQLRKEIGDMTSITKITNGIAYGYLVDTKYRQSYNLINGVVENLIDSKEYSEVVITLFNIGRACFYSKNFDLADEILHSILNLLIIFDASDLAGNSFLPEYNDIAVYIAALYFFDGEINLAKMNLYNINDNGKKIGIVEGFMRDFVDACIELEDKNKERALEIIDNCIIDFQEKRINQEHQLVFMIYEFALRLKKHGYEDEANEYFNQGLKIAVEKGLGHYMRSDENFTLQDYENYYIEFDPLNISLKFLEEKAEKDKLLNQLHKRLRDAQFFNKLVSVGISGSNLADNTVRCVFNYTMADAVFLAEKNSEGKWICMSSMLRDQIEQPSDFLWSKLVKEKKIISNFDVDQDKDRNAVFMNLSKFDFVGGIIIYLHKNIQLSVEEKNVLTVAAANIQAQIVMFKQNEYLSMISATDQLSTLNNRRALQEHISFESEMIRRYEKKKNLHMREAISFMDLDNFKYYNDTYGHEAGDLLISCFSKLLKKIYRKVDFIARFGGDEFVVMLPNTSPEEAFRAAERLKEGLEEEQYFIPDLERMLQKRISIPKEKYLNFSMGICSNADSEDTSDLEKTMSRADQALYYSKHHKKGSVTIWKDVAELREQENNIKKD